LHTDDFLLSQPKSADDAPDIENYNLETVEQTVIQKALDKFDGNISKSAEELGISRAALYRRMEKYDL